MGSGTVKMIAAGLLADAVLGSRSRCLKDVWVIRERQEAVAASLCAG